MIDLLAPPGSPVGAWVAAIAPPPVAVVVLVPGAGDARRAARPVVACLPVVRADDWFVADAAIDHVAIRADAYASTAAQLAAAVAHVAAEDPAARAAGPLRLTYLGALGAIQQQPAIGQAFAIGDGPVDLGRSPGTAIRIGIGHSDQSLVARLHARITRTAAGVRVLDLGSTNGVWLDGVRTAEGDLAPGAELAVAGLLRFRLDGAP